MILLHSIKYKDADLILYGYTREMGRMSFILHNVCKKQKSGPVGALHPLSILDITVSGKKSDLTHIKDFAPRYNLKSIRENIYKSSITLFISELLYKTLKDSSPNPQFYSFLENSILMLDSLEKDFANFHLWFLLRYISLLGYEPLDKDKKDIYALYRMSTEEILALKMNGSKRNEHIGTLLSYLEENLNSRIEIKSINILHTLLSIR